MAARTMQTTHPTNTHTLSAHVHVDWTCDLHLHTRTNFPHQISFDVFPIGWDKTYCLRFIEKLDYGVYLHTHTHTHARAHTHTRPPSGA